MKGSSLPSLSAEAWGVLHTTIVAIKLHSGFAWNTDLKHRDVNPIRRDNLFPPSLHHIHAGQGILTLCPSGAAFAIPLGPTNPWLITIAKETLIFRRAGISPALRLLVPAFSLPNAPQRLAPYASSQIGMLSYRSHVPKNTRALSFGITLKPRLSLAQNLSMSELLRFLSRMAASKPTSSLSVKFHLLVMH